jgi:hypothetical protein
MCIVEAGVNFCKVWLACQSLYCWQIIVLVCSQCNRSEKFLITNFRRVLYVVCFLLRNSPVSEFCVPTFRNTLFHLHRQVGKEWLNLRTVGVSIWERVWLKNSLSQLEGEWRGRGGSIYKAGSESLMTHMEVAGGYVKQIWLVSGWAKGWQVKILCCRFFSYLPMKMEQTQCFETSAYKIQTPANYPEKKHITDQRKVNNNTKKLGWNRKYFNGQILRSRYKTRNTQ